MTPFSFNLTRNIVALRVETYCRAYYRVRDQLDSQQGSCAYDGSVVYKQKNGGCSTPFFRKRALADLCLDLLIGDRIMKTRKGLEITKTKPKRLHVTMDFPEREEGV